MISIKDALDKIEEEINNINYPVQPKKLYSPIHYLLTLKGKKIRPVLTLLSYNLYKEDISEAINPAIGWEIFHNFTLMHDDLMDNAEVRRGKPVVHKVWNENSAILSGDAMLILAYQYIAKVRESFLKPVLDLFSTTAMEICAGQQYDMEFEGRAEVSEEEYLEMIRLKTAVMLGATLKTGALLAGSSKDDTDHLYDFGVNIGLAFQIKDDILDVYGDPETFGKKKGGDIVQNKKSYLSIAAQIYSPEILREKLTLLFENQKISDEEKINSVIEIYNTLNVREKAEIRMNGFYDKALKSLGAVDVEEEKKKVLYDLASDLMNRKS